MKNKSLILVIIAFASVTFLSFIDKKSSITPPYTPEQIEKGKYLVQIMGCRDCHSPKTMTAQGPAPDMNKDLSGHPASMPLGKIDKAALKDWVLFNMMNTAAVGPWGISFSANLSSDATGIGTWSEEQFIIALTEGKSKGIRTARPLLPPMPWPNYANMKKEDIVAIFAYLKSTKPVENIVPQPISPDKL
jgi:hypothetical protein